MSPIITTSFLKSHCDIGYNWLRQAGLSPFLTPETGSMDPLEFGGRLQSAYIKGQKSPFEAVNPSRIGKAWQLKASDIIVANAAQDFWGWADHEILPFLDFWADFEPEVKFALFYTEPGLALACYENFADDHDIREQLDDVITKWESFNDAMLHFYSRHQDRCLLADLSVLTLNPDKFADSALVKWDRELDGDPFFKTSVASHCLDLTGGLTLVLDAESPKAKLLGELQAIADCPAPRGNNNPPDFMGVIADNLLLKRTLSKTEAKFSALETLLGKNQDELKAKEGESELLSLQLAQVQEELEAQFRQAQLVNNVKPGNSTTGSPEEVMATNGVITQTALAPSEFEPIRLDLRQVISGLNWHEAEHDGRWGGPGTQSTLTLPELPKGRYRLSILIVGAMSQQIFNEASLVFDGKKLQVRRELRINDKGVFGRLRKARAHINANIIPYPAKLISDITINESSLRNAQLAIKFPTAISPTERGEADSRALTARISYIEISRI